MACGDNAASSDAAPFDTAPVADARIDSGGQIDAGELAIIVTPDTLDLDEGGTPGRFSVSLTQAPAAAVTLTVGSSDATLVPVAPTTLTFTPQNFATAQDVGVGAEDDEDLDDETITVTVSGEGLTSRTVEVTVNDDDAQILVVEPRDLDVTEGDTASFAVSLAYAPAANVTVTVTSAAVTSATVDTASLTFTPANFATPQTVVVAGVQDVDTTDDEVVVSVASTGLTTVPVAVTVVDDDVLNISATPGSLPITEGGATGAIAVTLTQQPAANVTVNVATSDAGAASISVTELTFTPDNYATAQNVVVAGPQDGDVVDETVMITFSATGLTTRTSTVLVDDDDVQALVLSANAVAGLTVVEGGAPVTFTVALQFNPGADTSVVIAPTAAVGAVSTVGGGNTLVFTAANFAVPQSVSVTGVQDVDLVPASGTVTLQALGIAPAVVNVTVTEDDTQAIVVAPNPSPNPVTVLEGGMTALTVRLSHQPAGTVMVNVTGFDPLTLAVSTTALTFNALTYATPQPINLMGVNDADLTAETTSVTFGATGIANTVITVQINDDDGQTILATPGTVSVQEGAGDTVMVSLSFMPAADTLVTITSPDVSAVTVGGAAMTTLMFTTANYATPQPLAVGSIDDDDIRTENVVLQLTAPGVLTAATVNVTVTDPDTQSFIVVAANPINAPEQGATGSFTVRLNAQPNDTRTINITSNDPGAVATDTGTLTFTTLDWMTPQTVTVSGLPDPDLADETTTVTVAAAPGFSVPVPSVNVNVFVDDDDGQNLVVAPDTITVTEDTPSGDDQFTVSLAFQPAADVTVTITSNSPAATIAPASQSLTFTPANYNVARLVSVTGATDANQTNVVGATITVASAGLTSQTVTVNVIDDDEQTIIVEPGIVGTIEGSLTDSFTVRLAYEPLGGTETITLASQAPGEVGISTTSIVFTTGTYLTPVPVTVSPQEDADVISEDVTIDLTSSIVSTPATIVAVDVTDNDVQNIIRAPASLTVFENGDGNDTDTIDVHLQQDPSGSLDVLATVIAPPGTENTVVITDGATRTFTSGDYTVDQTVTVAAQPDVDLSDELVSIHLNATGLATRVTTVTVVDDDEQAIVVSTGTVNVLEEGTATFGVSLAHQPSGSRSVTVTAANGAIATALPATLVFTTANWADPQTVTISGTTDPNLDPEVTSLQLDMLGGLPLPEGAIAVTVNVNVTDNDQQSVIVTSVDDRLQEGGPGRSYEVTLEFPPAMANGGLDNVNVSSIGEMLSTDDTFLQFTTVDFATPQTVTIYANDGDVEVVAENDTDVMRHEITGYEGTDHGTLVPPGAYTVITDLAFGITDDEITVLAEGTFSQLNDGTEFTERANVRANPAGSLVVTGINSAGDIAGASVGRDLAGFAMVNGGVAYADPGADLSPIFSVDHDGTDFGFFSSEGTSVRFTRLAEGLGSVAVTSTFAGRDVWATWNGSSYGVIARHATNNNLFFRTLNPDTGVFSGAIQVTTASPTVHEHANVHAIGSGWVTLYSAAAEVRCVIQAANGAPSFNTAMDEGYPTGGAYISSVYNPDTNRIMTVHVDPTSGLYLNEIDPGNCSVQSSQRLRGPDNYITVPTIALNGSSFVVAYDVVTPGGNQVGVLRGGTEDIQDVVSDGQRPSIVWAGDRWVLRAALDAGGIQMVVGSFETHCVSGTQDGDETGVDCGGAVCGWCAVEFAFTDTAADDISSTALFDFFATLPVAPGPNDWMFVETVAGDWSGNLGSGAKCIHAADWYVETYFTYANNGSGTSGCNPSDPEKYQRAIGSPNWCAPDTGCNTSQFGYRDWNGAVAAPYLFNAEGAYGSGGPQGVQIMPADAGQCELGRDGIDCSDGSWSVRIRVGGSRESTCPGSFEVDTNCGGGGGGS